jgi:hypothetical protein
MQVQNIEGRVRNDCCLGKTVSIMYSEYVSVASVIQHAVRMPPTILSSVICLVLPYFSALSHKCDHFVKTFLNIKCIF